MLTLSPASRTIDALALEGSGAHAVMLIGGEGTERPLLAAKLAQGWLGCSAEQYERGPVDMLRVVPAPPSRIIKLVDIKPVKVKIKGEENILDIRTFIRTVPLKFKHKVVVIECPERMNNDAASAFLKILEEPPPFVKYILCAHTTSGILPTILSRCVLVSCRPVTEDDLGNLSEMEELFSERDLERLTLIRKKPDAFRALFVFMQTLRRMPVTRALKASEEFRALSEKLDIGSARESSSEGVRLLGVWLQQEKASPEARLTLIESHRRIVGNGGAGYQLDPLFCQLLANFGPGEH